MGLHVCTQTTPTDTTTLHPLLDGGIDHIYLLSWLGSCSCILTT